MCIRDRFWGGGEVECLTGGNELTACLLYTSDAPDELTRVELGGRRPIYYISEPASPFVVQDRVKLPLPQTGRLRRNKGV